MTAIPHSDPSTNPIRGLDVDRDDDPVVKITWSPHPNQRAYLDALRDFRFQVIPWGRRSGKSEGAGIGAFREAVENPGSLIWWVAPTYDQANDYGFDKIFPKIPKILLGDDPKRSKPRKIYLANGSEISFRSADRPDALDGAGVDHLVIDEAAQTPPNVWNQHLRPTLSDTKGSATFISTPRGKNWFHDWYLRGQSDDYPDVWSRRMASYENPHIDDSEIDAAAREIPDRVFKQEYLAVFVDDSGGVFEGVRDRNVSAYDWEARSGNGPYTTGVDFARVEDYTVIVTLDTDGFLVDFDRVQGETWPRIQERIERRYQDYAGVVRVDATRDNKIVTDLEDAGVAIEAVDFRRSKKDMIENLATRLEHGEISLPDIPQLVNELELFDYTVSRTGNVSYHAPSGWHDDCVDALALAAKRGGVSNRSKTWGPASPRNLS